jgi:transcription antitermination factor NusG
LHTHLAIQQTEGVVDFVYWLGAPAVVKEEEIAAIRQYLNNSYTLSLEKTDVNINDAVRITSGALVQQEGSVLEIQNNTIKILLPSLGYAIIAVKTGQIEKITAPVQIQGLSS